VHNGSGGRLIALMDIDFGRIQIEDDSREGFRGESLGIFLSILKTFHSQKPPKHKRAQSSIFFTTTDKKLISRKDEMLHSLQACIEGHKHRPV
jgi:hypothetical protein